jgi:hypothetical protein
MIFRAADNETFLITRRRPLPKVVCTSYYDGEGDAGLLKHSDYLATWWYEQLINDDITLVGLNFAYDAGTTAATWPELLPYIFEKYEKNLITDVGIRQKLWDIAVGRALYSDTLKEYSLADLAELVLDKRMWGKSQGWRFRYGELIDTPLSKWPQEAIDYAKEDSITTLEIFAEQMAGQDQIVGEYSFSYSSFCLTLMTARGMLTDRKKVEECRERFEAKMNELVPALLEAGLLAEDKKGGYTKKQKPAQERIRQACEERGIDIPKTKTDKGISTDKVACILCGDELMLKRAEYITAEKMLSTYIKTLELGYVVPITTRFNIVATGRTSASTPRKPLEGNNFQNAPKDGGIRETYRPRDGFVYLISDISGAELHTLAQSCKNILGYSVLGDLLNDGVDVHLYVGSVLLGISFEEAIALYANDDPVVAKARQNAKAANFGFPGGMMHNTFRLTQIRNTGRVWTYEEIDTTRKAWLKALPEMPDYLDYCQREAGPDGSQVQLKLDVTGMLRTVAKYTVLANHRFQAGAAAGCLAGTRAITRECYAGNGALLGARPVNMVHDELVLEVPITSDLHQCGEDLNQIFSREFNRMCEDYPTDAEAVASSVWSKKAKRVLDENGRLKVWVSQ